MKHLNKIIIPAIALAFILLAYYTWIKSPVLTHGFASYYTSSRVLAGGGDMAAVYDSAYFYSKMRSYGFGKVTDPANIPGGAVMMLPFVQMEPVTAKVTCNAVSVIFLFVSIILLLKSFDITINRLTGFILILVTLLYYPLYYNIAYGQAYLLILLLASLAVYGFKQKNLILTSAPVALMIFIKGYGIYPLAALLLMKRYREFFTAIGITIVLFTASLPLFGLNAYTEYYNKFYSLVAFSGITSNTAYQTINSLLGHIFSYDALFNTNAVSSVPQKLIYYILQAAGFSLLMYAAYRVNKVKDFPDRAQMMLFISAFAMNVLFAPGAEDHHSVLYLPLVYFITSFYFKDIRFDLRHILLLIAVLLLALPLPFRQLQDSVFTLYLFAYPRVYGAVIMVILAYLSVNKLKTIMVSNDVSQVINK